MINHPELPPLAGTFFARFARFESALKAAKYRKPERGGGVSAHWDEFAHEPVVAQLFDALNDNPVAAYLIGYPPKKRVLENDMLGWREVKSPVNMVELASALCRIRNNLFHGDKANPNLTRNAKLLSAGLEIMNAMLEAHNGVRQEYEFMQEVA